MRKIKFLGLFTILFAAIFALNINISAKTLKQPSFYGTEWKLTKINTETITSERSFTKFDEKEKRIGGNGGCNSFGGSMVKNGSKVKFSQVFSTKMFCQDSQEIENKFLGLLEKVTKYQIKNGKLYLKSGNKILLEFEVKK